MKRLVIAISDDRGFTLVELMAVVVILGVLASVVVQTVPDAVARAKRSALAANLATMQGAVDRFFADTGCYPTYEGDDPSFQPEEGRAVPISGEAAYPGQPSRRFLGDYVRFLPPSESVALGLDLTRGEQVFWGVAGSGLVFCTQTPPGEGGWEDTDTYIYTQEALEGQALGDILAR